MTVHFDEIEAFVIELERDALDDAVSDQIVRMVVRRSSSEAGVNRLAVLVGYKARGELVQLTTPCGRDWRLGSPEDQEAHAETDRVQKAFRDLCAQHGLDLRSGVFR